MRFWYCPNHKKEKTKTAHGLIGSHGSNGSPVPFVCFKLCIMYVNIQHSSKTDVTASSCDSYSLLLFCCLGLWLWMRNSEYT